MNAEEIVNEFMARIVRMDLDGACELVSDDVEYDNVPIGKVYGPDGDQGRARPDGRLARRGRLGHPPPGRRRTPRAQRAHRPLRHERQVDGAPRRRGVRGHDGRITLWRDYFDMTTFTNQLTELAG